MIDYELAEKIGATHIHRNGDFYKVSYFKWMSYNTDLRYWEESMLIAAKVFDMLKPIPPKRTRTEYEKVTESIFDLRDEFERGELYFSEWSKGEVFVQIKTEALLLGNIQADNLYRRVEKEIDWHSELDSYLNKPSDDGFEKELPTRVCITLNDIEFHLTGSEYLESCRVALRANGELD